MSSQGPPYILMLAVLGSAAALAYGLRSQLPHAAPVEDTVPTVAVSWDDYTRRQPGRPLIAGFSSYASVSDVLKKLEAKQIQPKRQTIVHPPDARHPPAELDTLVAEHFSLLNTQGRLSFQFFNDRLYEIGFKPEDMESCTAALKKAEPQLKRDNNGRAERTDGSRRIASNVELASSEVGKSLKTEPFVLWQDLRLVRERDDWDQRFGSVLYQHP